MCNPNNYDLKIGSAIQFPLSSAQDCARRPATKLPVFCGALSAEVFSSYISVVSPHQSISPVTTARYQAEAEE